MPRRRRHWLAVDYNTANPALRVAALAQNATDEPAEATSEVFLLQKGSTTRRSTPRGPKDYNTQSWFSAESSRSSAKQFLKEKSANSVKWFYEIN